VINEREAHQKAAAAADGVYREAIEPGKRDRNDRRNRDSPDSQARRRNGNPLHQGAPLASDRCAHSNRADSFSLPFQGWAFAARGGEAEQGG
jgi:hypothetical protein